MGNDDKRADEGAPDKNGVRGKQVGLMWASKSCPEITLAYYRGTVPKYEKPKRFSYIETVPKAATQGVAFDTPFK